MGLCNHLPEKNDFRANIIGNRGDIRRFKRERNGRNGLPARRRCNAVNRPVVSVRGRTAIAKDNQLAAAAYSLGHRNRSAAYCFCFLTRYLGAKFRVVRHLHSNRVGDFRGHVTCGLLFPPQKGVEKFSFADVVPEFAALEEDVHRLPKRVVKQLDQFLLDKRVGARRRNCVGTLDAGKPKRHRASFARGIERGPHLRIAFGRPESHYDIVSAQDCIQPRAEKNGEVERRKRALPYNDRMYEFDRHMLRVGRVWAPAEGQQTAAAQKTVRHFAARFRQSRRLVREE